MASIVHAACYAPFLSSYNVCKFIHTDDHTHVLAINTFDGALSDSIYALSFPHELTQARLSIDDLVFLVKSSEFSSEDMIVEELVSLAVEAKEISRAMQKFHNQVRSTVNSMLAIHGDLLRLVYHQHADFSLASGYCTLFGNWLHTSPCRTSHQSISRASARTLQTFQSAMESIAVKVSGLDASLDHLEAGLDGIRDLIAVEAKGLFRAKANFLGNILTSLGLHRKRLAHLDGQIRMLKQITKYRSIASRTVLGAHRELQDIEDSVEDLHLMAANGDLAQNVPLEAFIAAVISGLEGLRDVVEGKGSRGEGGEALGEPGSTHAIGMGV
ncbi:hypothetical protein BJ138DRAFT_1116083 [Hygrophoropsis aurantiaca]|uniref:Uncharacterized protein n=1 Tax=Hygrophoropsis aurantiaca TaxID=72124 RepID=A0ACB8A4P0_9AGAM|nr:hypothetical protein BJ138DRAFT_1116083 [Hygrophoropsis aurantiaca]